jgi:ribose transport system substrate-binding protein
MESEFLKETNDCDVLNGTFHDARGSQSRQDSYLKRCISDGVDFIMAVPIVAEAVAPIVERTQEENIPFICVDRNVSSVEPASYIASDNTQLGSQSVELLYDFMHNAHKKDTYNIIEIQGDEGASVTDERHRGGAEAIRKKDVDMIDSRSGVFSTSGSADVVKELIDQYGTQIDGIYAHNDLMALGAHQAVCESPLSDIPITGIDGSKKWVEQFDHEPYYGTIAQLPEKMVSMAVEYGIRAAEENPIQDYCQINGVKIIPENANEYLNKYF